jgi:signal transduction histidine kinase
MEERRGEVSETREGTDASLGAERAAADGSSERAARIARRVLDDFIERDRNLADASLLRFRARADGLLALERLASPTRDKALAVERRMADENKEAERSITDGALDRERHRADAASAADLRQIGTAQVEQEARRLDTDKRLGAERSLADALTDALGDASEALASATNEHGHRGDVLAMVSHDLRSPLTVIALSAGFLLEDSEDSATREVAQDIVRSAARMERLLTDLLDVARIESGTLTVIRGQHDVGELLRGVFSSYRPLFADRGLTFTSELPSAPMMASIDHDRVVQVLANLLGNALKFTPSHGTVGLSVHPRPGEIEVEVRDNGPGIPADAVPHVFERFWQIEGHTGRGLGLGLYICEQIVGAHGGRIWVESASGAGTAFRFTLPVN